MHTTSVSVPIITTYTKSDGINAIFEDIAKTLPKNGTYFRYSSRTKDIVKTVESMLITTFIKT